MMSSETRERLVDLQAEVLDLQEKYSQDNLLEDLLWLYALDVVESIIKNREKLVESYIELYRYADENSLHVVALKFIEPDYAELKELLWEGEDLVRNDCEKYYYEDNAILSKLKVLVYTYRDAYINMSKHKANKFLENILYILGQVPF